MSALGAELRAMIAQEGPISIERFMQLALQHPVHGYYTSRMPFGRAGDFVTAPEISQMFGELVGLWAAQVWMDQGAAATHLVELGPGRGTMMADVLRATHGVPAFTASVHLVETSPVLEAAQRAALAASATAPTWHRDLDTLPEEGPIIVLANEFFDALPVRHYVRSTEGWHERQVGLDANGALVFGMATEPIAIAAAGGYPGAILEIGHAARRVMTRLAARIAARGGALLVCDYGHAETAMGETLQAVRGHAFADPLADPGEADLTTHVDFAMLRQAAEAVGARAHGPVAQGAFLTRLGLAARAARLKTRATADQVVAIDAAVHRLAGPTSSMATLFKVLAITPSGAPAPPGFEDAA